MNTGNSNDPRRTPGQGLTKEEALRRILEGHWRYLENRRTQKDVTPQRLQEHAEGQYPFAAILGCADSRVSPELIFDQDQGDLFVVRVAGNILGAGGLGSIEYAVDQLAVRLILVFGHEQCGAVRAAIDHVTAPGAIGFLLGELAEAVDVARSLPPPLLDRAVEANVRRVTQLLPQRSEVIGRAVAEGRVRIVGAVYRLGSGDVDILDLRDPGANAQAQ
ncbi:MAG: carbonic anhydrase [Rariglobus sp.]|jgi:carbonic anhydrase|nr:carbonic anhydrase [Rariglobus sp.]